MALTRFPLVAAGLALVLVVSALVLKPLIDRSIVAAMFGLGGATQIRLGAVHGEVDHWVAERVHLESAQGSVTLDAPRAVFGMRWIGMRPFISLTLSSPQLTVRAASPRELVDLARTALAGAPPGRAFDLALSGGTIAIAGLRAQPVRIEGLSGDLAAGYRHTTYDLHGLVHEGANRYPFSAIAQAHGNKTVQRWDVPQLPLPVLGVLTEPSGVELRGGTLTDVEAQYVEGGPLHGSALLTDGALTIDGHPLDSLAGSLVFDRDEILSNGLQARDGDAAVTLRGISRYGDLDLFRELYADMAGERGVQSIVLEATAPGVAFGKYVARTDDGPLAVSLLDVNPADPTVRFDSVLADDKIFSGAERTSSMAQRTGAVAGIDGDYFDMGGTSAPQGLMVRGGVLLHSPNEMRETLAVHRDKSITFDLFHFGGTVTTARGRAPITMFNDWPPGEVGLVTPDLGRLPASPNVTFVALSPEAEHGRYRVDEVTPLTERRPASFGLAFGPLARAKLPRPGETVQVEYAVTPSIDDVVAAVASGPVLLKDGAWYEDPHAPAPGERDVRWPVVGVGKLPNGRLLWAAVDGRYYDISIGMTRPEFAALLERFGVRDAIALDSGGSVTMVARVPGEELATVRNHPSDSGGERWVANGLFIYSSAPASPLADLLHVGDLGATGASERKGL